MTAKSKVIRRIQQEEAELIQAGHHPDRVHCDKADAILAQIKKK